MLCVTHLHQAARNSVFKTEFILAAGSGAELFATTRKARARWSAATSGWCAVTATAHGSLMAALRASAITFRTSNCSNKLHHPLALRRIRQSRACGVEIVDHVFGLVGAGQYGVDGFMSEQVFEEKLAPGRRVEVGFGPIGYGFALHGTEQGAAGVGQVA